MSYSKLPVSLDDLNKIPRFTASQLMRALLIVIAEDSGECPAPLCRRRSQSDRYHCRREGLYL